MLIKINQKEFQVKVLVDKKSQEIGMKKNKFSSPNEGLLFLMGGNRQCFWMKDCIIHLDIIIIENNTIKKIHHNCPPCNDDNCQSYCGNGNIVLELFGNSCKKYNIEEGDSVEYVLKSKKS